MVVSAAIPIDLRSLALLGGRLRLHELDREATSIRSFLGGSAPTPAAPRKRRRMSAAARAAISAATKKRWAEWRRNKQEKKA